MTREEILMKSAGKLNDLAADIKATETIKSEWPSDPGAQRAKADHDECLTLAVGLLMLARPA